MGTKGTSLDLCSTEEDRPREQPTVCVFCWSVKPSCSEAGDRSCHPPESSSHSGHPEASPKQHLPCKAPVSVLITHSGAAVTEQR